jgi:ATP-dependent DNA helicase DinG
LRLGGGVILPAPEDCFYIFDEGHQLPSKCLNHFALRFHSGATLQGLRDSGRWVESSSAGWIKRGLDERIMPTLTALFEDLLERTLQISETVWALFPDEELDRAEYRLPHGRVPAAFAEQAALFLAQWEKLHREAARLEAMLENRTGEAAIVSEAQGEPASDPDLDLINAQGMVARAEQQVAVWKAFAQAPNTTQPGDGWARWCLHRGNLQSVECQASPILPGELLKDAIWDRAAGAVVTSATLAALGTFDRFRERSGIPNSARWKQVASPFDPKKAIFSVPAMTTEPSQADAHTEELITLIPELIRDDLGVLLLFTSRRQLEAVLAGIAADISHHRLVQDQLSKSALIKEHRRNIDEGEPSAIFGLASFFEGIDLPGDYCRHVVIAKLPFAVPDDPISSAHAELLDAQGRDPFMEINVPDAAQKLIQASGRLQRTEDDEGRITLLDKRLLSRRYGRVMLETLPAFTFELAGRASR